MTRTRHFRLTLPPLLLVAATAAAQGLGDGPRHVPIPSTGDSDPAKVFAERIGQAKFRTSLDDLFKQLRNGPPSADLLNQLQEQLTANQELQEQMRRMMRTMDLDMSKPNCWRRRSAPEPQVSTSLS